MITKEEIKIDIADTQKEIDDYIDEKEILMRNPQENKVRIYLLEGKIGQRKNFIEKLTAILEERTP